MEHLMRRVTLALQASRSLQGLGVRREGKRGRAQIFDHSRRIVGLFNEKDREYGPIPLFRSRFILRPAGF